MPILPHALTALLYATLGVVLVRSARLGGRETTEGSPAWVRVALLIPLVLHALLLHQSMFDGDAMYLGVGNAISSILWLSVLIYWAGSFYYRLDGLQALVIPVAAVAVLMPLILPPLKPLTNAGMPFFRAHLVISMAAYSLFTIASLHALLMMLLERTLHGGTLPAPLRGMPPLLTMERLLFRIIFAGFVLLTLSLVSGMLFSETLFGRPLKFTHKTAFGIVSWLIFGTLLLGRSRWGWRGRRALRWTFAGFLTLVLAYLGSKFVLEVILHR
ncbi:MAG: cytochrome c biogenesis protein CcsA [Burkholderiales bacterium]|nr:cytochrome c biogenesis protein CcsA [Burkholderiales bacterium]